MNKISVFITHSLGELDVILPIFADLQKKKLYNINIIFTNKLIYNKFIDDKIYIDFCKIIEIKTTFIQLFNKFDYKYFEITRINLINKLIWKLYKIINIIHKDINFILRNYKIIKSDIIMNDGSSNELKNSSIDFILFKLFKKKNFVYNHGHSLNQVPLIKSKIKINPNATVLSFHKLNFKNWSHKGYNKIYLLGFPKFFSNWLKLINNYKKYDLHGKYILIYSRESEHKYYMNKRIYNYLLINAYESIRVKFPDHRIIIKVHPRENLNNIKYLIKEHNMNEVEVSAIHAGILAKNAKLIISFWTSAILDSLALDIPSIEFYKETENFRILEPEGSLYKKVGIHTASNKQELMNFFDLVINKKYTQPKIIKEFKTIINLKCFEN